MTNYTAYISFREALQNAVSSIQLARGLTSTGEYDSRNDKHTLCIGVGEMGYGYYGSSSYYTCDNKLAKDYLNRACKEFVGRIGDTAIKLLNQECERLRVLAEEEARTVLMETKGGVK